MGSSPLSPRSPRPKGSKEPIRAIVIIGFGMDVQSGSHMRMPLCVARAVDSSTWSGCVQCFRAGFASALDCQITDELPHRRWLGKT